MDEILRLVQASPGGEAQARPEPYAASDATRLPSFETMDRVGRAMTARMTQGISPQAIYAAWFDWASHLARSPGRLIELGLQAANLGARFAQFARRLDVRGRHRDRSHRALALGLQVAALHR